MSVEPEVAASFPNYSTPSQLGAGVQVAGAGVPTTPSSPTSTTARGGTTAGSGTTAKGGTTTGSVFGPTAPGMLPGTLTYPETGVINQPSTKFHEMIAERAAPAALGMIPGLGLASSASGLFGGPTLSGLFANSSPGLDIGLGSNRQTGGEGGGYKDAPAHESRSDKPTVETKAVKSTVPLKSQYAFADERYLGPPKDPKRYGYGPERRYFERTS
jgi:hypothetical protein